MRLIKPDDFQGQVIIDGVEYADVDGVIDVPSVPDSLWGYGFIAAPETAIFKTKKAVTEDGSAAV